MAKAKKQSYFDDMEEEVPEEVATEVDAYITALRSKNKAQEKLAAAKERTINVMVEHKITKVRIDEGAKWLVCEENHKLKTEKIKSPTAVEE